jgi:hypothetical protein
VCSAIIRVNDYSLDLEYRCDPWHDSTMLKRLLILVQLAAAAVRWFSLVLRSQRSIEAENLFLRRQLALYVERRVERRRIVNTIARKMGLKPPLNGQLIKTALEAGGLAARRFAAQLLGLRPQRVANGLSGHTASFGPMASLAGFTRALPTAASMRGSSVRADS